LYAISKNKEQHHSELVSASH